MASNGPMILCDGLVKIYKVQDLEMVALGGLDLMVDRGEFMAIIGPSGSGKSTLMNILGGLDRPSAGRAIVDGQDLLKMSNMALTRYRREKVGFVWQQPSRNLIPYLTVLENAELPMIVSGMAVKERETWTRELLESVGLWERRNHALAQLSGGEQQRTAIAVGLANKPVLLLADEPTGEVDTVTAQSIIDTLHNLSKSFGLTIVMVTHDTRASDQVDRVVTIRDGRTSSERVRRLHAAADGNGSDVTDGEDDSVFQRPAEEVLVADPVAAFHEYVVVDSAGRLQVPREFLETLGISDRAQVDLTDDGILIRPAVGLTDTTAQAARLSDVAESWGPQGRSRDWRGRVGGAGRGLQRLLKKGDRNHQAGDYR